MRPRIARLLLATLLLGTNLPAPAAPAAARGAAHGGTAHRATPHHAAMACCGGKSCCAPGHACTAGGPCESAVQAAPTTVDGPCLRAGACGSHAAVTTPAGLDPATAAHGVCASAWPRPVATAFPTKANLQGIDPEPLIAPPRA